MEGQTFTDLLCESLKCLPEDLNETVFWLCLFPQALLLARLLWRCHRGYFRPDFELLEQIKGVTNSDDLLAELNDFRRRHPPTGFLRGFLKVRLSGQALLALGNRVFTKTSASPPLLH